MTMRKSLLLYLLLLLLSLRVVAGPVTPATALQKAQAFAASKNKILVTTAPTTKARVRTALGTTTDMPCYAFDMTGGQGFVLVSADDRTPDVLGYCDHGSYDAAHLPEGLVALMEQWAEELEQMDALGLTYADVGGVQANLPTTVVAPLMTTKWNQSAPYNNLCPMVSGNRAPTGCVATAMAQIIYYHKHPSGRTTAVDGYSTRSGVTVEALPATTFAWSSMLDRYSGNNYTTAQANAVAKLMQYCGSSVQMGYGANSSGAFSTDVPYALRNVFGYAQSAQLIARGQYTIAEWDAIITNELTHSRPVYLSASTTIGEGHAFVCDGRDQNAMYHINRGWGGNSDGYYRLSLLDAIASGIGGSASTSKWSFRQGAIIGISPTNATDITGIKGAQLTALRPSIKTTRNYTRTSTSTNFENITIYFPMNLYGTTDDVYYGLGLYQNGSMVQRLVYDRGTFYDANLYNSNGTSEQTVSFGQGLANGTYQILPIFYNSSRQWQACIGADRNYVKAEINGRNLSLTVMPEGDFEVQSYNLSGRWLTVNFYNGGSEYNGYIFLRNTKGEVIADEMVAIPAGAYDEVRLYVEDNAKLLTDNDIFYLSTDHYNREYFYTNGNAKNTNITKTINVLNADATKKIVYGNTIYYNVTMQNQGTQAYHHQLNVRLTVSNEDAPLYEQKNIVSVEPGETKVIPFSWQLADAEMNKSYFITAIHMNANEEDVFGRTGVFTVQNGVTMWDSNGAVTTTPSASTITVPENVAAVDLRTAGTDNIEPNSNPNTIYLLGGSTIPASLTGKNVVASTGKTGTINLYSGYDYYIPVDIDVRRIYYNFTPTLHQTNIYTPLTLPFAPAFVKNASQGNATLTPMSADNSSGDFWLLAPASISGNVLTLDNVESMRADLTYFLVVPGTLEGQKIVFGLEGQGSSYNTLPATAPHHANTTLGNYSFWGTNQHYTINNAAAYVLQGDRFERVDGNAVVAPFGAYLTTTMAPAPQTITIASPATVTAINRINTTTSGTQQNDDAWYTLQGQRIGKHQQLPAGIYIHKGRKVVVK